MSNLNKNSEHEAKAVKKKEAAYWCPEGERRRVVENGGFMRERERERERGIWEKEALGPRNHSHGGRLGREAESHQRR